MNKDVRAFALACTLLATVTSSTVVQATAPGNLVAGAFGPSERTIRRLKIAAAVVAAFTIGGLAAWKLELPPFSKKPKAAEASSATSTEVSEVAEQEPAAEKEAERKGHIRANVEELFEKVKAELPKDLSAAVEEIKRNYIAEIKGQDYSGDVDTVPNAVKMFKKLREQNRIQPSKTPSYGQALSQVEDQYFVNLKHQERDSALKLLREKLAAAGSKQDVERVREEELAAVRSRQRPHEYVESMINKAVNERLRELEG